MAEVRCHSGISQVKLRKITDPRSRDVTVGTYFQLATRLVSFHRAVSVVYMFGEYSYSSSRSQKLTVIHLDKSVNFYGTRPHITSSKVKPF